MPSFLGYISEDDTFEEVIKGWVEVSKEYGDVIPPSSVNGSVKGME